MLRLVQARHGIQHMRIALFADIHGNLPAFEAVLNHSATQQVDQICILGDVVVGSPDSAACWALATSLGCPMLRGNHERYVGHYGTPHADPAWRSLQYGPVQWAVAQFSEEERQAILDLPRMLILEGAPELLLVHASLRSDADTIAPYTPDSELQEMFPDTAATLILRGHNHVGQVRLWNDQQIVTVGSVGLPLDGYPTAQYCILEQRRDRWYIIHQAVAYDVDATLRQFVQSGYLEMAGPMARLFMHEVAYGSHYIVPFLRTYRRWQQQEPVQLADAVRRFLE